MLAAVVRQCIDRLIGSAAELVPGTVPISHVVRRNAVHHREIAADIEPAAVQVDGAHHGIGAAAVVAVGEPVGPLHIGSKASEHTADRKVAECVDLERIHIAVERAVDVLPVASVPARESAGRYAARGSEAAPSV